MRAALRYRGGQALALALLAALVTACAVLAPLFSRAVEQSLLRAEVGRADPAQTAIQVARNRTAEDPELTPEALVGRFPEAVLALHHRPVGSLVGTSSVVPQPGRQPSPVLVIARDDACAHLRFAAGRCPTRALEVAVSAADARAWSWSPGRRLVVAQPAAPGEGQRPPLEVEITGVYEVADDPGYWLGAPPDGKSGVPVGTLNPVPAVDDLVTPASTFATRFPTAAVTVSAALDRSRLDIDSLPAALRALATVERSADADPEAGEVRVSVPVEEQFTSVRAGQDQVALIVPVVMMQVGLLAAVVLLFAASSAVDQRRGEVALARLRGRSRAQTRWFVMSELAVTVLLGLPVGILAALALNELLRRTVLPAGVPFELPVAILWWLLGAQVVSLTAVYLAARPVLGESVSALLRQGPVGAGRRRWGVVETLLVLLAAIGVAGLLSGALSGIASLATPALLGLALGLLAGRLLTPLAGWWAARAVGRGRVGASLGALALARRPSAARVVTVVTVATGLAVFGANAVAVADLNRQARAELESGAPTVLTGATRDPLVLVGAAEAVRRTGVPATPVVVLRPRLDDAQAVMAIEPETFAAVAYPQREGAALDLDVLAAPAQETVRLVGRRVTGTLSWRLTGGTGEASRQRSLVIGVTMPDGSRLDRTVAEFPVERTGRVRLDAPLLCPNGCRLDSLKLRLPDAEPGDPVVGAITVDGLGVDGVTLQVSETATWSPGGPETGEGVFRAESSATRAVTFAVDARDGASLVSGVADVPRRAPAITAGELSEGGPAMGLNGLTLSLSSEQAVPALPVLGSSGAIVSMPTQLRLGGAIPQGQGSAQIWLGIDDPAAVRGAKAVLAEHGFVGVAQETYAERKRLYDESASGWGLRLALVAGLVALPIAVLVLVLVGVAGWRSTARDLAALQVSGVPARETTRALVQEHTATVLAGLLAGLVAGVVGGALAMPLIPLVSRPAAVPTPDFGPVWWAVAAATAAALLVLLPAALAVALRVARRVGPHVLRENS